MRVHKICLALSITAFGWAGAACTIKTTTSSAATDAGQDSSAATDTGEAGLTPIPTKVDCTKPENCYHLACWDDPACATTPDPGGCKQGQVKDLKGGACRDCTADDCDGLSGFCCGTPACAASISCQLYICKDIDATCAAKTSATCGFHDLDGDDAWGDCDEAPSDPCCWCKIAVGCSDSLCGFGNYVQRGACAPCSASSCDRLSCMGLNGCPTNCPAGAYFDGVTCRACYDSSSESLIPAYF